MMRVLMENIFNSSRMNQLFKTYSERQYEQELLFSTIVDLISLVVCGMYPSVHAAYQKKAVEVSVSATALYNKLQRIELPVSRALVHETASDLQELLRSLNVERPSPLGKEYWLRIVDGSCLAGTERRLAALRPHAAKPLPGKTIAILDPQTKLLMSFLVKTVMPKNAPCLIRFWHKYNPNRYGLPTATSVPQDFSIRLRNLKRFL